jgi:hypothetical protein
MPVLNKYDEQANGILDVVTMPTNSSRTCGPTNTPLART